MPVQFHDVASTTFNNNLRDATKSPAGPDVIIAACRLLSEYCSPVCRQMPQKPLLSLLVVYIQGSLAALLQDGQGLQDLLLLMQM